MKFCAQDKKALCVSPEAVGPGIKFLYHHSSNAWLKKSSSALAEKIDPNTIKELRENQTDLRWWALTIPYLTTGKDVNKKKYL